jgi:hypothetical protein
MEHSNEKYGILPIESAFRRSAAGQGSLSREHAFRRGQRHV